MIELLYECSWRAMLMAAGVGAVFCALRIKSAKARHAAWCGAMMAMLILPAFWRWGPRVTVRVLPANPVVSVMEEAPVPMAVGEPESAPRVAGTRTERKPIDWVATLYLLGFSVFLARLVMGTTRAHALRKRAVDEGGFCSSTECASAVTVGWWRPVVVLPVGFRDWPREELDAVLAHEGAHVQRRDPLVQWLAAMSRCVYWFHPLAWWLEWRLGELAEEICDSAAIAKGCDPGDFAEYLIRQARAVERAGVRVGVAMGGGALERRIRTLLEGRAVSEPGRGLALACAVLCGGVMVLFAACDVGRVEKAAPGQPTMNELMHRRVDTNRQREEKNDALTKRAQAMTAEEAGTALAALKKNPEDADGFRILEQYYEFHKDVAGLSGLRLWFIEHHPDGKIWPGNIEPWVDRAGYERGKALWLAALKRPGASVPTYRAAALFFEAGDEALAEATLVAGRKTYPDNKGWAYWLGTIYAKKAIRSEAFREELARSKDAPVLVSTAQRLMTFHWQEDGMPLARRYVERGLEVAPDYQGAKVMNEVLAEAEQARRGRRLANTDLSKLSVDERVLVELQRMEYAWTMEQKVDEAAAMARRIVALTAGHERQYGLYGDAVYQAHTVLGKAAFRHGDRRTAVREMMLAAGTAGSGKLGRGIVDMNLARALIDAGERTAVAEFLEKVAPKGGREKQYLEWAGQIRRGINPDGMPIFGGPGCAHDPC